MSPRPPDPVRAARQECAGALAELGDVVRDAVWGRGDDLDAKIEAVQAAYGCAMDSYHRWRQMSVLDPSLWSPQREPSAIRVGGAWATDEDAP